LGAVALNSERHSAQMSKIINGGLHQYGKVYILNGIGGKRVNRKDTDGMQPKRH